MRCCFLLGKVVTARAQLASTRSSCNLLTANRLRVSRPSFSSRLLPGLTQPVTLCELFSRCTLISWNPEDGDSDAFSPLWGVLRSLDEMCHVNFNQGLHSKSESWYSWTVWKENVNWGREVAHQKWTRGKSQPTQDFLGRRVCMHANRKQEHSLCFPGNCLINNRWLNCIAAIQPLQTIFFPFFPRRYSNYEGWCAFAYTSSSPAEQVRVISQELKWTQFTEESGPASITLKRGTALMLESMNVLKVHQWFEICDYVKIIKKNLRK